MKKLLVLASLILSISLVSCSSDDDGGQDPIIGTWDLVSYDFNGDIELVVDCDEKSEVTFTSNGDYSTENFEENTDGDCVVADELNGTWELVSENKYAVFYEGESDTVDVEFSNSNRKFAIVESEQIGEETFTTKINFEKK